MEENIMVKKIYVLLCIITCSIASTSYNWNFPPDDNPLLVELSDMCVNISSILEGKGQSCFISRAWPRDGHLEDKQFLIWCDKINFYLNKAGIKTFYDTSPQTGLHNPINSFINEIANADTVLVILTPGYKKNMEQRKYVYEEMLRVRENKPITRYVLLAGSLNNAVPDCVHLPSKLYYPVTSSDVRSLADNDGPSFKRFIEVICDLLHPNRENLVRSGFEPEKADKLFVVIEDFKKKISTFLDIKQENEDHSDVLPRLINGGEEKEILKEIAYIKGDIHVKAEGDVDVMAVDQEGGICVADVSGSALVQTKAGDANVAVILQEGGSAPALEAKASVSGIMDVINSENSTVAYIRQEAKQANAAIKTNGIISSTKNAIVGEISQTASDTHAYVDLILDVRTQGNLRAGNITQYGTGNHSAHGCVSGKFVSTSGDVIVGCVKQSSNNNRSSKLKSLHKK